MTTIKLVKTVVFAAAFVSAVAGTTSLSAARETMSTADQYLCNNAKGHAVDVDIRQFCPQSDWLRF
jgi:hypothetical protein